MAAAGLHLVAQCKQCGSDYRQARSDQMYCRKYCAHKAWHSAQPKSTRNCVRCGSVFDASGRKRHCGVACYNAERKEARLAATGAPGKQWSAGKQFVPRQTCEVCGSAFYAPPVQIMRGGGKFCSVGCRTKFRSRYPERYYPRRSRGKGGKRADLGDTYFRSRWEANYARYLNWLQTRGEIDKWEYEVDTFEFPIKRGSRFYTPDFKVHEGGAYRYVEVKGHMDARSATKLKRMRRYFPQEHVDVVRDVDMKAIYRALGGMLANWERGSSGGVV